MNVGKGDLAYIRGLVKESHMNDRFVTVWQGPYYPWTRGIIAPDGRPFYNNTPAPAWLVRTSAAEFTHPAGATQFALFRDENLRRIDNPPDSAADLLLAPLPQQDKVPA